MKIELGCGMYPRAGFQGIDLSEFYPGIIVHNLNDGLPKLNEPVDEIWADNVLEHIQNLIQLMNDCYDVCVSGGKFHIKVPLANTIGALKDPTHVRHFVPESFDYFDLAWSYHRQPNYGIRKWHVETLDIQDGGPYTQIYVVLRKP